MSLHTVFLSDLFRKQISDAHSAPLCPILKLTGEQIYSDLKKAKTPKHDVVRSERTGHSRKLLKCLSARSAARQKPERNVKKSQKPFAQI